MTHGQEETLQAYGDASFLSSLHRIRHRRVGTRVGTVNANGAVVQCRGPHPSLRRRRSSGRRVARRVARSATAGARRSDGPVRFRQVDADAHPRGPRQADERRRRDRRRARSRRWTTPSSRSCAGGTSASCSSSSTCCRCSPPRRTSCCRCRSPARIPDKAWMDELLTKTGLTDRAHASPLRALWRSAAARRDRARARLAPRDRVRGRADRQPRLEDERRDPGPDARLRRHARSDDGDGHARGARGGDRRPRALPGGRLDRRGAQGHLARPTSSR